MPDRQADRTTSPLDGRPAAAGSIRLRVVRGSRTLGIRMGQVLVATPTPLGADYGHRCQVGFSHRGRRHTLLVRSVRFLGRPECNLCDGGGHAVLRVAPLPGAPEGIAAVPS